MVRISIALKRATWVRFGKLQTGVIKTTQKKLRLRSRKVRKRYSTVNGVAFRGKIESEEGTEKTPVGKP